MALLATSREPLGIGGERVYRVPSLGLPAEGADAESVRESEAVRRLGERFALLTGGSRAALPRQRTLRAMVDWSWDLQTAAEQSVLARLSVFAGSFGRRA